MRAGFKNKPTPSEPVVDAESWLAKIFSTFMSGKVAMFRSLAVSTKEYKRKGDGWVGDTSLRGKDRVKTFILVSSRISCDAI